MLLTKIIYILLIIICTFFYVLYIWDFSLVLLVTLCAIPVIMFFLLFITKRLISAELKIKDTAVAKNEAFDVQLSISNRSFFPIGKAEAVIEYYNVFSNQINDIHLHFPIQSRNSHCLTFQLSSKFCGIIKLKCAYIAIYDPLRIFKFKICRNISNSTIILPEGYDISAFIADIDRESDESEIFSESRAGDDPSEVFDLREYYPGDKVNRIHWKLSSKKENWIIREFSLPVDSPTLIFLNLYCPEDSEYTLPLYDTLIESFVAVSRFMIENERVHKLVYFNAGDRQFIEYIIDSIDALSNAAYQIMMSIRDDLMCDKPEKYFLETQLDSLTSFTYITADDNEDILMLIDEKIDADIKNAIISVKKDEHSSVKYGNYTTLNVTPVVIGRITSSIRDIEI